MEEEKAIVIDGNSFSNSSELMLELTRKLTKGIECLNYEHPRPINLDAVNDYLRGDFGVIDDTKSTTILWKNSFKSKKDLGRDESIARLVEMKKRAHPSNLESIENRISLIKEEKGQTLFDEMVDLINSHQNLRLVLE